MNELLFLKFAHVIAFVYWLGGDLGTFLASKHVINRELDTSSRQTALKIMLACDQGPKMSMPLILPLGIQIAVLMGLLNLPTWALIVMWIVACYWLANVLILYFNEGKPFTILLSKIDLYFRIIVVAILVLFAASELLNQKMIYANWVSYKILVFAALVCCGIFIRINLKPFIPAFIAMMQNGATPASDAAMENSVKRCRPFVWTIWLGLFVNAAIGVHLI